MTEFIDLSNYFWYELEDCIALIIKKEEFSKHIHELVKEIYPLIDCKAYLLYNTEYKDISLDENFNAENYPLNIEQYEEDNIEESQYKWEFYCCWNGIKEDEPFYPSECWLANEEYFFNNVRIRMSFIPLWQDFYKFNSESESKFIRILNTMARSHYKTPLSKSMLFYISG